MPLSSVVSLTGTWASVEAPAPAAVPRTTAASTTIDQFPETTLNCILNMGKGVYQTADRALVNYFIDCVMDSGFQTPMIEGVGDDWQIKVNNAHIQNIRVWMELIGLNPKQSRNLISNLIDLWHARKNVDIDNIEPIQISG